MDKLPFPCVRNCCLDDANICLGCGRSYDEILAWHTADKTEQLAILERSRARLQQKQTAASARSFRPRR